MWDDGGSDSGSSESEREEMWALNEQGEWVEGQDDGDDWSTDEEDVAMEVDGWSSSDPTALQPSFDTMAPPKMPDEDIEMGEPTPPAMTPDVPQDVTPAEEPQPPSASSEELEKYWKRFDVLPSAPVDHAFFNTPVATPSRTFLARLTKEYRVLESSLPGMHISYHHSLVSPQRLA